MKKFIVLPLIALALAVPATANAWTFSASGSAACDRASGQYVVTWTVDNSSEPEVLTITATNRAAVPTGASVGARASSTFTESVAGSTSGSLALTVSGNWPSDSRGRTRGTSVSLAGDCTAPPPPLPPPPPPPPPAPPPPVTTMSDDCPNLEGVQGSVPEGMIKDSENNCVTRPTPTEPQPTISSPPAAPAPTPVVAPAVVAPAIITTQPTEGVARATKTKVKRKAARKAAPKAKKAKKKVSAGGIKGAKPSALPRTR